MANLVGIPTRKDPWRQTRVDNQGAYLAFKGAAQGDNLLWVMALQQKQNLAKAYGLSPGWPKGF